MNPYTEAMMLFPVTPALTYLAMILHQSTQEIIDHYEARGLTPEAAANDARQALRHQTTPSRL